MSFGFASMGERSLPRVGLGCMGMSEFYGPRDDGQSLAALVRAFDIGYRHFDTADMYGLGHNEELLGKFLAQLGGRRDELFIASKVGFVRDPEAKYRMGIDARPERIRACCDETLRRLGTDRLDLYYLHRQDPATPIAESVGALGDLVEAGKVRAIGLSEVSARALEEANAEFPIAAVQSEYSLWSREVEAEVLPACKRLGVAFVAFSPLGRGFLTGAMNRARISALDPADDLRCLLPRFQDGNVDANLLLVERLVAVAARLGVPPSQLALAWVLARGEGMHVIPGSRSPAHMASNLAAGALTVPAWAREELEAIFVPTAVSGGRYPARPPAPAPGGSEAPSR